MQNNSIVYLDWNILNKLWQPNSQPEKDRDHFAQLESWVEDLRITVPYSNAHMRDLSRGVSKRPEYANSHIETIKRATNNLCITQYWGENNIRWHYRDCAEFLADTLNDSSIVHNSFADLYKNPEIDETGLLHSLHSTRLQLLDLQELPSTFKECYKADPIFSMMFPKSKVRSTMLSLCEDLFDFSMAIMSDNVLYKHFRKYLNVAKARSIEVRKVSKELNDKFEEQPTALTWDEMWDSTMLNVYVQASKNSSYKKVVDLYTTTDLKGYQADERFSNMIDDALHTFYGSYCDYFVTMDNRCLLKAKKVYADLKHPSQALSLSEFVEKYKA